MIGPATRRLNYLAGNGFLVEVLGSSASPRTRPV